MKKQNMIEHGLCVRKHHKQIIEDLSSNRTDRYKLPDAIWFNKNLVLSNQYDNHIMSYYQIYHSISSTDFLQAFKKTKHKRTIANLIASNRVFLDDSMTDVHAFLQACETPQLYWSLLISSYAQLYAKQETRPAKYEKLKKVTERILHEYIR